MDEYQYYSSDEEYVQPVTMINMLEIYNSDDSDNDDDHNHIHLPPPLARRNPLHDANNIGARGAREGLIHPGLLEMVHRQQDRGDGMSHRAVRPEVLETWLYNWQTKERQIPQALVVADQAIKHIEKAFQHLKDFHDNLFLVSSDLQPSSLVAVDKLAYKAIRTYSGIIRELEEKINAIRLYWFPETVEQFKVGAYKSVRQYVQDMLIDQIDMDILVCSTCLEPMRTSFTQSGQIIEGYDADEIIPIVFRRRCQINPLLSRQCDLQTCKCILPSICLNCALDHLLKNGLHEGKTSVRCPACRGEVCIYDIQEINLIVKQPPPAATFFEKHKAYSALHSHDHNIRSSNNPDHNHGPDHGHMTTGGNLEASNGSPPAVSEKIRELNELVLALKRDLELAKSGATTTPDESKAESANHHQGSSSSESQD